MENSKIEQYLIDMMVTYRQIDANLWLLDDDKRSLQGVVVMQTEPLVIIRAEIMDVPKQNLLELYAKLLELNAVDIIHGAYALDNGKIVLIDTLEYDTMDYEEFRAALDTFSLALTQHYPILSK
ncbi:MAG: YbjN domain-containing protein, partial [Treponema sp.]|nr:YbjN domain-containing protein [Treponema sp.]